MGSAPTLTPGPPRLRAIMLVSRDCLTVLCGYRRVHWKQHLPKKDRSAYYSKVSKDVRILLLADTHLGFDLPSSPRVGRRRRGHDFLANYALALEPALSGEVDLVVHGGDVFDRSSVPSSVAYQ